MMTAGLTKKDYPLVQVLRGCCWPWTKRIRRAGLYFEDNLLRLRGLGFKVEVFRPNASTHEVTEEMKAAVLSAMP
jgi:hypothetical protein